MLGKPILLFDSKASSYFSNLSIGVLCLYGPSRQESKFCAVDTTLYSRCFSNKEEYKASSLQKLYNTSCSIGNMEHYDCYKHIRS
jgi:hypothetical protein